MISVEVDFNFGEVLHRVSDLFFSEKVGEILHMRSFVFLFFVELANFDWTQLADGFEIGGKVVRI